MAKDVYESPLSARYADKEMKYLFSPDMKFRTWRKLWIALAEAERELGLPVTQEQIDELKEHADDINYEVAQEREKVVRHDVMSHVYAYGQQCPKAAGIIHLGATSCYVGDNTDIIVMTEALKLIRNKIVGVLRGPVPVRRRVQRAAHPGLYPLPAGPAHHRGQAGHPVDAGPAHGPGGRGVPALQGEAFGL